MDDSNELPLPPNHQRVPLIIIASVFSAFGTLVVFARLYIRKFVLHSLGWDDYTIIIAWVLMVCFIVATGYAMKAGMGYFTRQVPLTDIIPLFKATLFIELSYASMIYCIKMSISFCLLRISIALKDRLYIPTKLFMAVITMQFVACFIVILVQCRPITYFWNKNQPGKCLDHFDSFLYFVNIFTVITDVVLVVLPIPFLVKVNRSRMQKFGLISVFAIGLLSTISSGVRLYTISQFAHTKDPAYDAAPITIWSFIEINLGLACACAPALKGLFSRIGKRRTSHFALNYSDFNSEDPPVCEETKSQAAA